MIEPEHQVAAVPMAGAVVVGSSAATVEPEANIVSEGPYSRMNIVAGCLLVAELFVVAVQEQFQSKTAKLAVVPYIRIAFGIVH